MDGQRFDQLARAFSSGASRRQLLKGLIGGAIATTAARFQMRSARAQCTWSGTFEAPFGGGIVMTLQEAGGQVSGSYTFTQDNAVRNGSIRIFALPDSTLNVECPYQVIFIAVSSGIALRKAGG